MTSVINEPTTSANRTIKTIRAKKTDPANTNNSTKNKRSVSSLFTTPILNQTRKASENYNYNEENDITELLVSAKRVNLLLSKRPKSTSTFASEINPAALTTDAAITPQLLLLNKRGNSIKNN